MTLRDNRPKHLVITASLNLIGLIVTWVVLIPGEFMLWRTTAPDFHDMLEQLFIIFGTVLFVFTLFQLWAIQRYWQGYSWARIYFVLASGVGLVGMLWPPYRRSLPTAVNDAVWSSLAIYQLWWLLSREARAFFDKENRLQREEAAEAAGQS